MSTESRRGPGPGAAAGAVLARLAVALGARAGEIVVVGGLAAPRLGVAAPLPHEGTTDIDVVLEVAMDYDLDEVGHAGYGWLERALVTIGARPSDRSGHWRWLVDSVHIDVLCDRYPSEYRGEVVLPGAPLVTAMQLSGPAAAVADARTVHAVEDDPGSPLIRIAGVGGYLIAKAAAADARRQPKDWYDFWWVCLNAAGGPPVAAEAVMRPHLAVFLARHRISIMALADDGSIGGDTASAYADTMNRLGSAETWDVHVQDVVAAAAVLRNRLRG